MSSPFAIDRLVEHAERTPEAPAVDTRSAKVRFGELADRMREITGTLKRIWKRPFQPGKLGSAHA